MPVKEIELKKMEELRGKIATLEVELTDAWKHRDETVV